MAECPDPTLCLSPSLVIFPFNRISEETYVVKGFLPKENLKAKSPKLLKHSIAAPNQRLPSQGPWLCTELATSPGGAWGRTFPKEDRWAG